MPVCPTCWAYHWLRWAYSQVSIHRYQYVGYVVQVGISVYFPHHLKRNCETVTSDIELGKFFLCTSKTLFGPRFISAIVSAALFSEKNSVELKCMQVLYSLYHHKLVHHKNPTPQTHLPQSTKDLGVSHLDYDSSSERLTYWRLDSVPTL